MPNLYRVNSQNIENRGENNPPPKKPKTDFKTMRKNTVQSLNDVEYFLNNFEKFLRYVKLYKLLK